MSYFLICIITRLLLAFAAFKAYFHPPWLKAMGAVATVIAAGFFVIWLFKLRETGIETGGKKIWWDHLRPVHALLYALFAVMAFSNNYAQYAYVALFADVALGLGGYLTHKYMV